MKKIKRYFQRRRIRRLAERILAHQIAYSDVGLQIGNIDSSINIATMFYARWKESAK